MKSPTNWFLTGGEAYSAFRPEYPEALARFLANTLDNRELAVDVGCGSGQLTRQLAEHFETVIGVDSSQDQIAYAQNRQNVTYRLGVAEALPLKDRSANLIVAAQAAHWFDLDRFYAETRRVGSDKATIALISYGVMRISLPELQNRFDEFYMTEIGSFWPPERKLVESGYSNVHFPFEEIPNPHMMINQNWKLGDFLDYLSTWSAIRNAKSAGCDGVVERFVQDVSALWGNPERKILVHWPVNMRLGKL